MKTKSLIVWSMVLLSFVLFLVSCSKKRLPTEVIEPVASNTPGLPTSTRTNTPGGPTSTFTYTPTQTATPVPAPYHFNTDQTADWDTNEVTMPYFTLKAHDTSVGHAANGSMRVSYNFAAGNNAGTIFKAYGADCDYTGLTISFWVYVPANLINATNPAGYQIYVKTGSGYTWYSKPWTNISGTAGWQQFSWVLSSGGQLNGAGAIVPVANITQVKQVGLKIGLGGSTPAASGQIWFDDLDVPVGVAAATSTNTPVGPTYTPTNTLTYTNTPTGPTYTPTETATTAGLNLTFNTDVSGWTLNTWSNPPNNGNLGFVSAAHNTNATYIKAGAGSCAMTVAFSGADGATTTAKGAYELDISNGAATPQDLTGKKISIWVYAPAGFPTGYGAMAYIKTGAGWTQTYGSWVNVVPGAYTEVTFSPSGNGEASTNMIGIQVGKGGGAADFSGTIYFDEVTITTIGAPTATPTPGGALYQFESGVESFILNTWSNPPNDGLLGFTALSQNTNASYVRNGSGSLQIAASFTGADGSTTTAKGAIERDVRVGGTTAIDLTGKTITYWIYVPVGFPTGYGASVYFKDSGWTQHTGAWVNMDTPGAWKQATYTPSGVNENATYMIGLQIGKGAGAADWTGNIHVDDVNH